MFKVFLTNLGKYNEGELVGEWIDLPISDEELDEVYNRIGINFDEPINGIWYEETFITDYENDVDYEVGEYESIKELNKIAEISENLDENDHKKLAAALELGLINDITEFDPWDFWLAEDITNASELGQYYVDEGNLGEDTMRSYFDYDSYGHDLDDEFSPWDMLDIDPDDEDRIQEVCDEYDVDSIDDINAMKYYGTDTYTGIGMEAVDRYGYPSDISSYFDTEQYGSDIQSEVSGGFSEYGWIEAI